MDISCSSSICVLRFTTAIWLADGDEENVEAPPGRVVQWPLRITTT